jgi:hypothetical protein
MRLLDFLAQAFINAFGITQPSAKQHRLVSLVLGGFILSVILIILIVSGFLLHQLHTGR